jgi:hypothetical protein
MANQVVLVQPLHHDYNASMRLIIEAAEQHIVEPRIGGLPTCFGMSFICFLRIVDYDNVRAPSRESTADRGCQPPSAALSREIIRGLAVPDQVTKEGAIEGAAHDLLACGCEVAGKILPVARTDHMLCGIVTQKPGDKGHRDAMGFQTAS